MTPTDRLTPHWVTEGGKVESVVLASNGYRAVRVDEMTLVQAREAIQALGQDILSLQPRLLCPTSATILEFLPPTSRSRPCRR